MSYERGIVSTVAELIALPVGSVVLDQSEIVYQLGELNLWHRPGDEMSGGPSSVDLPARVLHRS